MALSWRIHLERYELELSPASVGTGGSFSGADYVDVHVRAPGLAAVSVLVVLSAVACVAAPFVAERNRRGATLLVGIPLTALVIAVVSISSWLPPLVQRFAVDPNPLLSEQPFLLRSIAATRSSLELNNITVESYSPTGTLEPADLSEARDRLANVLIWDEPVVRARMLDLVTQTPFYRPEEPTLDVVPVDGRPQPTMVSVRQLDLDRVRSGRTWINDRLAYTHGRGLVRFSGTDIEEGGQPRLLGRGLGLRQPRIYYGDFGQDAPSWVVANTLRPEVDISAAEGERSTEYHYGGSGGIALSSWVRRAALAFDLGSKDLLLSDDITPQIADPAAP